MYMRKHTHTEIETSYEISTIHFLSNKRRDNIINVLVVKKKLEYCHVTCLNVHNENKYSYEKHIEKDLINQTHSTN